MPGRSLKAGPLTVEFDNGQLRYLKVNGVEVLRVVGFLIRDKNWGTATPAISDLKIDQRSDGFSVATRATCKRGEQEISYRREHRGQEATVTSSSPARPCRKPISLPRAPVSSYCTH